MSITRPIRLGLIGAGIFARDAHVPSIKALGNAFDVVAIFSRTQSAAEGLNDLLPRKADVYTDITAMLNRDDIEAVDVVLPILAMPDVVAKALKVGKHVISEKPIAPTVEVAQALLSLYGNYPRLTWMVAENWRYEAAFIRA